MRAFPLVCDNRTPNFKGFLLSNQSSFHAHLYAQRIRVSLRVSMKLTMCTNKKIIYFSFLLALWSALNARLLPVRFLRAAVCSTGHCEGSVATLSPRLPVQSPSKVPMVLETRPRRPGPLQGVDRCFLHSLTPGSQNPEPVSK